MGTGNEAQVGRRPGDLSEETLVSFVRVWSRFSGALPICLGRPARGSE